MIEVRMKKLVEDALLPQYKSPGSAGADLFSAEQTVLAAKERKAVSCGFAMQLPPGFEAQIRPRSGLAMNAGITVLNSPGTIDWDYRGEVKVVLFNTSETDFSINKGDRIAQMIIAPVERSRFIEADHLDITFRGERGFGSTGRS